MEAPMPGMVIRYEVKEGDTVNEGDVVLILEAMKMENEIRAPRAGVVKDITIRVGESVEGNAVMLVLAAPEAA